MSWNGVKQIINTEDIKAWCEEMGIENYTINSKGEIDVDGGVFGLSSLNKKMVKELPYKFGIVKGSFDLSGNKNLTSLKNCPDKVGGYFSCSFCPQLDSLKGCPKEVGGYFNCGKCKRKFTEEEVKSLCYVKANNLYL